MGPLLAAACRQHPGEPMAEWFAEGLLERLTGAYVEAAEAAVAAGPKAGLEGNSVDDEVGQLLQQAVLYIVPNMNPDGSVRWVGPAALGYLTCTSGMSSTCSCTLLVWFADLK